MRVVFHASVGKRFDDQIAEAFASGCRTHRVDCRKEPVESWSGTADADVGVVVGVKGSSAAIFRKYREEGRHAVFIDKGYTRIRGGPLGTLYLRASLDAFQPLEYFQRLPRRSTRWDSLGVPIAEGRRPGRNVVFAGSSQKYCNWHGLGDATRYAQDILGGLAGYTSRSVVYRPKPSWGGKEPVDGFSYSGPDQRFDTELSDAHAVVTHGSNACFEALINGVPTVVLGEGIARPLAATGYSDIDAIGYPPVDKVHQLAYDLAHCQWTLEEIASGALWQEFKDVLKWRRRV